MMELDETRAEESLDGPKPIDDVEAAAIAAGSDDDDDGGSNVNEKCDVIDCPCMSQNPCSCVGHTHVLGLSL